MSRSRTSVPDRNLRLFTRYPTPGTTKTRLIPELGEQGAAELQRTMTEHLLRKMLDLDPEQVQLTVSWTGANREKVKSWLDTGEYPIRFSRQNGASLGDRLLHEFQTSFAHGHQDTVVMGTDCPDITVDQIRNSFRVLQKQDLVLGPARDGGYYLIGLSTVYHSLFSGIDWGTDRVLEQTVDRAESLDLDAELLEVRRDIDRPEDLFSIRKSSLLD